MRILRSILLSVAALLCYANAQAQQRDTVYISDKYTTTFYFPTNIIFSRLSNQEHLIGAVSEKTKEIVYVRARDSFDDSYSFTCIEASGLPHTYIIRYKEHPLTLLVDEKNKLYNDRPDTVYVSSNLMTLFIYSSEIVTDDLSRRRLIAEEKVEESPNVLSLMARIPHTETSSLSLLESSGKVHTYILRYKESPSEIIIDERSNTVTDYVSGSGTSKEGSASITALRSEDAPTLKEVFALPQSIYHIATKHGRIEIVCENIFTYSDILYITLRLTNHSGVSYEADGASFELKRKTRTRRQDDNSQAIIPTSVYGILTAAPGQSAKMSFSFQKLTLQENQCVDIKIYEKGHEDIGGREFFLRLDSKEINLARKPVIENNNQ